MTATWQRCTNTHKHNKVDKSTHVEGLRGHLDSRHNKLFSVWLRVYFCLDHFLTITTGSTALCVSTHCPGVSWLRLRGHTGFRGDLIGRGCLLGDVIVSDVIFLTWIRWFYSPYVKTDKWDWCRQTTVWRGDLDVQEKKTHSTLVPCTILIHHYKWGEGFHWNKSNKKWFWNRTPEGVCVCLACGHVHLPSMLEEASGPGVGCVFSNGTLYS